MKKFALKKTLPVALFGLTGVAGVAFAAMVWQIDLKDEIYLSSGGNGHKPKIQRAGDGTLVTVYGDSAEGAELVYDTKDQAERPARDIYARWCKPDADTAPEPRKTCDLETDWSAPVNLSQSASKTSMSSAWQGTADPLGNGTLRPYAGDIDKPNIKTSGPVMVTTWVSKYCPDGDLQTPDIQAPVQRAVRYLELEERVIPFSCTWAAYSTDSGKTWKAPIQLSTGERDAKQDASGGTYNLETKKGQVAISWQEDPEGLQLGEADGPGDGASGANTTGGTDVWYTWATVDLSVPSTPADDFVLAPPSTGPGTVGALGYRITDNWELEKKFGVSGQINHVFDGAGVNVDPDLIEKGNAAAARPNIGMVGTTTILGWEETKGASGLDEGKFVRYQAFKFDTPPVITSVDGLTGLPLLANEKSGCVISDPAKNGRRVRFLTQSPADAGAGGINIAIFWKEGLFDKGGPSDIVVRRGMGGLQPANMVPAVDAACATSDYTAAIGLASAGSENISSRAREVTDADPGLTDDTEANFSENALAHRGVLRGNELWIGYNYTADLVQMWAQLDNYDFWVRKFTFDPATGGAWGLPRNLTNIADKSINVREPRFFGTPNSSATFCPSEDPAAADTTDPTFCQNPQAIFVAYGTQTNVSPFDPEGGDDLGIYITASRDGGETFIEPIRYSTEMGSIFDDDDFAFEAQIVTRPDGTRVYGMFNTQNDVTETSAAAYRSGDVVQVDVPDPVVPPDDGDDDGDTDGDTDGDGGSGGCSMSDGNSPFDPTLLLLGGLGLAGLSLRRLRRR